MGMVVTNATGDGLLWASVSLPDSGTSVKVVGNVKERGEEIGYPLTGSPVTIPAAPGSGSIFYIIQADTESGALSVKESTTEMPEPDAGAVVVLKQTLISTSTDPALVQTTTPDEG